MSAVTDQPPAEQGGLAPDPTVTPVKGGGAKKLPILLGVMTALLVASVFFWGDTGDTTFEDTETDFVPERELDILIISPVTP